MKQDAPKKGSREVKKLRWVSPELIDFGLYSKANGDNEGSCYVNGCAGEN